MPVPGTRSLRGTSSAPGWPILGVSDSGVVLWDPAGVGKNGMLEISHENEQGVQHLPAPHLQTAKLPSVSQ